MSQIKAVLIIFLSENLTEEYPQNLKQEGNVRHPWLLPGD